MKNKKKAIGGLLAIAVMVGLGMNKIHASPASFAYNTQGESEPVYGFRIESENSHPGEKMVKAALVYLCVDKREGMYIKFPTRVGTATRPWLYITFDEDIEIELDGSFLNRSSDGHAYFLAYNAPNFAGNAPARSVYRGVRDASKMRLRLPEQDKGSRRSYTFNLTDTAPAMRKANTAGDCNVSHFDK